MVALLKLAPVRSTMRMAVGAWSSLKVRVVVAKEKTPRGLSLAGIETSRVLCNHQNKYQ